MTISARVIADSISLAFERITTLELFYPRFIHSEFMTHRVFSRNASSSRAIPVARLIKDVMNDPAMPISWRKNKPGMQAGGEINKLVGAYALANGAIEFVEVPPEAAWFMARDYAISIAKGFNEAGYAKEIVNRLLEPFAHIKVVVTATDWDNFFALRLHPDAQPEIQELARQMKAAMDGSTPALLDEGDYHLPYASGAATSQNIAASAARCARTSYTTHDGKQTTSEQDLDLYRKLFRGGHWSPFEHQATPFEGRHANLNGWISHRTEIGQ